MSVIPNSVHARDIASIVHPQTNLAKHREVGPLVITGGEGSRIFDDGGKDYIESVAGLWCASLGFQQERLAKVAYEQMRTLGYYHSYRHRSNEPNVDLAEKLLAIAPVPMSKVLFQCSGSEANDTAIKLIWYYHNAIGKPEKRKIIARSMGYHGSTAAAVSLSGKPDMHADFGLPFEPFRHTEFPHYYRRHEDGESEEAFSTRMAEALEALILEEGPETVGGFFAEPVMGAGGAVLPPATYFEKIQAVLKKYEILFVADEVICGFGRTGEMWGSTTYNLEPDMISSAKALSAAMQPISALMINEKVYQAMLAQSGKLGPFAHGYTYAGHPVASAVALEVLKIYEEMDVVGRVKALSPTFMAALEAHGDHPLIGDIRGTGLICGIELMRDGPGRVPFEAELKVAERFQENALKNGLIPRAVGDRLVFAPPLIITEAEIAEMSDRFGRALDDTWAEIR
ncbi:MAG: aminotransferase class III-fold pyridoxal phosphate-dependent enzyme [Alphaproteobacteria bacterium]|jgi:4-aminobutyrate--pyruvate transaminase|nr:aminotransferase class III-fold pyridoxal phosphate-dependent enzyme [Alphaproteobacteria bacterium]